MSAEEIDQYLADLGEPKRATLPDLEVPHGRPARMFSGSRLR